MCLFECQVTGVVKRHRPGSGQTDELSKVPESKTTPFSSKVWSSSKKMYFSYSNGTKVLSPPFRVSLVPDRVQCVG